MRPFIVVIVVSLPFLLNACGKNEKSSVFMSDANASTDFFLKTITVTHRLASDIDGVVLSSCLSGETLVGGGCDCTGNVLNDTAGYLFACVPVANSYAGACYAYDVQTFTNIEVKAICAATQSAEAVINKPANSEEMEVSAKEKELFFEEQIRAINERKLN